MTHQPAISFSISFLSPFNRAGGRTSNVREEMKSYRYSPDLIAAVQEIPVPESSVNCMSGFDEPRGSEPFRWASSGSRVIRVGGFRALGDLRPFRFASSSSSVTRVGGSSLISGSSSSCLPARSRSDRHRSFVRPASNLPDQIARTSRDAPTGHKLFNRISTSLQPRRWAHF